MIKLGTFNIPRRISVLVTVLDEQPALPLAGTRRTHSRTDEREATAQFLTVQRYVDFGSAELRVGRDASFGSYVPLSQTITIPAPYWPSGITPSKSAYSTG